MTRNELLGLTSKLSASVFTLSGLVLRDVMPRVRQMNVAVPGMSDEDADDLAVDEDAFNALVATAVDVSLPMVDRGQAVADAVDMILPPGDDA